MTDPNVAKVEGSSPRGKQQGELIMIFGCNFPGTLVAPVR
jgi:hypothetical protein